MKIAILGCAVLLTACATPEYHQQRAAQATPVQLCEAIFYGPTEVHYAALNEANLRGLDCNRYRQEAALMYQQRGQRNAAADAALQNYLQSLRQPRQAPNTMDCTAMRLNSQVTNINCR